MKMLAEEQIKNGQVADGIITARGAVLLQKQFYSNMINAQVEETMLLLAEAYTVNSEAKNALDVYQEILDGGQGSSNTKDIYRKMAPLYTQLESYDEAALCLKNVIK